MKGKQILFAGLVTVVLYAFLGFVNYALPVVKNLLYDLNLSFSHSTAPEEVVIVGFDSHSIDKLGNPPWPRSTTASLIEKISSHNPKAIAIDMLFPKIQNDQSGTDSLIKVFSSVENLVVGMRFEEFSFENTTVPFIPPNIFEHRFKILKNQELLADEFQIRAKRVLMGDSLIANTFDRRGFLNISWDPRSQIVRGMTSTIRIGEEYYPSFGLAAAAAYYGLKADEFILNGEGAVHLSNRKVEIPKGRLLLNFRGGPGTIKTLPAIDILEGKITSEDLKSKLVFVGITDAPALPSDFFITPGGTQFPGVEIWATSAADIISGTWVKRDLILELVNWLSILILFPGFLIFFRNSRKIPRIIWSFIFMGMSIAAGILLMKYTGYIWDSSLHIFTWFTLVIWLGLIKDERIIFKSSSKLFTPSDTIAHTFMPPPTEETLNELPRAETAYHVYKGLFEEISQGDPQAAIKYQEQYGQGAHLAHPVVLQQFSKIAGGRIIKLLGVGGMADVYLTWHPRMEMYRAVKVIKPGQPPQWLERFETEIKIFSSLDHPNIVKCFSVGEWNALPYIEMEFIDGMALEEALSKCHTFSLVETLAIGALVARALTYAHTQKVTAYNITYNGVIHRDLKPANILITRTGQIKLTDFGIAKPESAQLHTMESGKVIGTLPYLSTEQIGGYGKITHKTDIYALGATMYEFITGEQAFPQKNVQQLIAAKTTGEYKQLIPSADLPSECIKIINKAMHPDPNKAFNTAAHFGEALERTLSVLTGETPEFVFTNLMKRIF